MPKNIKKPLMREDKSMMDYEISCCCSPWQRQRFTINMKLTFVSFFCRHKRKVQNFLPCKTPTRGPLDPSVMPVGHSAAYEDPDIHMGHHRPLVMRQHPLNVEVRIRHQQLFCSGTNDRKESFFFRFCLFSETLMRLKEISIFKIFVI